MLDSDFLSWLYSENRPPDAFCVLAVVLAYRMHEFYSCPSTVAQRVVFVMSYDQEPVSPMFRIDVSAETDSAPQASNDRVAIELLRQIVVGQQQQNKLLQNLIQQNNAANQQRASELQQWKNANPELSGACRRAAETLSKVQTEFLGTLTEEIEDSEDHLIEGEYMLNEFVDRFGPRLAHLNGVLQVLAQLGTSDAPAAAPEGNL